MIDFAQLVLDADWLWTSIAGLLVGFVAFLAAIRGSSLAPILVMLTVPLQRVVLVGDGGVHLTWTQVALAGFVAGAGLRFLRGELRIRVDVITIASFAVLAAYAITVIVADNLSAWAGETYRWSAALLFLVLARPYAATVTADRNLAVAVTVMAFAAMGTGVLQALTGAGPASFERFGVTRAYGAFGEPNPFGAFAVLVTLPCIALAITGRDQWRSWIGHVATLAAICGVAAVLVTQSRGAGLGLLAGVGTIAMLGWLRRGAPFSTVAIGVSAVVVAAFVVTAAAMILDGPAREEVTTGNWPERERQAHWGAATHMFVENPLLGVGAGGFNDQYRAYTTEWRFRISQGHAHNAYLQVAAETGIAGLVAYLALLGVVIWRLLRRIRNSPCSWLAWGALAATAAIIVHGLFDYLHVLSLGIVLSGIWAFAVAESPSRCRTR